MPILSKACSLLAAALFYVVGNPAAASENVDLGVRIDKVLASSYKADAPGITIIVVKDGNTLLRKGYGLADIAQRRPLMPDAVLHIASLTKQFTSTAILMLVDDGKINLGDDITLYLPDYPTKGKRITIEHLLTHSSGIVSYTSKGDTRLATEIPVQQMIDSFKNDPLEFEPGSDYKYNNSGYYLLGAIIEKVSGKTYDKFVEQRIFVPLGMTHTAYAGHERIKAEHALGYTSSPKGYIPSAPIIASGPYAAGALVSTVDDLARWDAAVSSGKLLKAATWQRAFTPYILSTGKTTAYGYGWGLGGFRGTKMVWHDGGIDGFNSFAMRLPSEKVYVAVLSNAENGVSAADAAYKAAAIVIGKPFPNYQEVTLAPALLDACTGVYQVDAKGMYTIRREGDHLTMHRPGSSPISLQAFSENGFFAKGDLTTYEFARDASGKSTRLTVHYPTSDSSGPRTGDAFALRAVAEIDPMVFAAYVGRYQLAPNFILTLRRDGERFWAQATGQAMIEVFPLNDHILFTNDINAELRFDDTKPDRLVLAQNGREFIAKKLP
jgi:D-alanyl-D-alanine carboxypeptidase